ncbi:hemagglutinin repeat-containing protein [Limnohabitans sp. T6-5]|uniref:hemagglutinin repeat-containing protein n=1 Tax=Limnohabitans sp. T6-5 TaxID=1100724 RepID=UPI0011B1D899|nr:hemagglutinin repeat-containing protein [Limnohabitans sp. T6-5]
MNAGVQYGQQMNLRPGIALSAEQMCKLTADMVWLVNQSVTLADGSQQTVLVPQVYARLSEGDVRGNGALMSGGQVDLAAGSALNNSGTLSARTRLNVNAQDLTNSGTIAGRSVVSLTAENVNNLGGRVGGNDVSVTARQDLNNIGGSISAVSSLSASAGRDLNIQTTTQSTTTQVGSANFNRTGIDRVAGLYVSGGVGALVASAGRDLNLTAAAVSNAGTGDTKLSAGNNLNLNTVTTRASQSIDWDANNYLRQSNSQDVGSQVNAAGKLTLSAGQDLNAKAAQVSAGQELKATAGNNLNITAGEASQSLDKATQFTSKDLLSSSTTTTRERSQSTSAIGSNFEGNSVSIQAGQDLTVKGSNVLADQDVILKAGGNVNIEAAQNTNSQSSFNQTTKSGLLSGGGLSVTLGKQMQSVDSQGQSTTAAGSTVGSTGGNVTINAGKTYTQTGSDILTPGLNSPSGSGDINISAQQVDINEARETGSQSTEQKFKQSGLTLAITSPVISALQTASSQLQAAGNTSSGRMQALAAANAGFNLKQGADAIKAGQGDANGMVKTGATNPDGTLETVQGNAADKAGGIGISLSLGASSSQSKQQSSADTAKGSNLNAGGNVTIQATGAGANSDITVRGSSITAAGTTALKADDQVNIVAAQNTTTESSNSTNSSGSIGVGMQLGAGGAKAGVTVSASAGNGQGAGNSTTYTNSQVAGNNVNIQSGGDTNILGGVVKGDQVTANVGGNLNIESLQDSSQYKEKSQQVGGSVTVGPAAGGSVNLAATKINSDYKSVNEQSVIRAGDGGFNVNVQGKTELMGGQITSKQAAIDSNKNSYEAKQGTSTTDLNNSANYSAQSVSVGIGAGALPGKSASAGMSGVGFGSDSGSASSVTTAGISDVTGNAAARTGDKSTSINPIFNKEQVKAEVNAQVAITSEFGKQASKAVGDYAGNQLKDLSNKANAEIDPVQKAALQAEAAKWDEGGAYRVAMHTAIGGLTGGTAGAVGAGAGSAAAPTLNELQGQLQQGLQNAGLGESASKVIAGLASGTTAAAIGAAASGGSVAGGATAFNADMNNRQLHPTEVKWIKDNAKRYAQQQGVSEAEAEKQLAQQAFRQVQFGVEGATDVSAQAFLKQAGNQQLPGDSNVPGQNVGYMFYATPAQKADPSMYAQAVVSDPQALAFYAKQGLVQPSTANLLAAAQKDSKVRGALGTATAGAGALAVGVTMPAAASWCLSNPVACNRVVIAGGEIAAGDALGPTGLAIGGAGAAAAGLKSVRSADEVNAAMKAVGKDAAWSPGTAVINAELKPGTKVQMVVSEADLMEARAKNLGLPMGSWASFDDVASQAAARQDLALPQRYKSDVKYVIEYEVVKPLDANIGFIGKQNEPSGQLYRGGATQTEFLWSTLPPGARRQDYLKPVGEPKPLSVLTK